LRPQIRPTPDTTPMPRDGVGGKATSRGMTRRLPDVWFHRSATPCQYWRFRRAASRDLHPRGAATEHLAGNLDPPYPHRRRHCPVRGLIPVPTATLFKHGTAALEISKARNVVNGGSDGRRWWSPTAEASRARPPTFCPVLLSGRICSRRSRSTRDRLPQQRAKTDALWCGARFLNLCPTAHPSRLGCRAALRASIE
jgi:hypothetical protein